jgi:hypothetical protein
MPMKEDEHPIRIFFAGACACVFYLVHIRVYYTQNLHQSSGALWACHVGCLLVGFGAICVLRSVVSIGTLMLVHGSVVWLIDLASGSALIPTSLLTHVGGLLCAAYAIHKLRWKKHAWLYAVATMIVLLAITRIFTPAAGNVNLAFSVPPGWQRRFPHFPVYFAFLFVTTAATYAAVDAILSRVFPSVPEEQRRAGNETENADKAS